MARRLKGGVLEAICKYTEDTEVPAVFSVWTGVATVSAVLGRDCFIDQGYFTIYPNVYIVLTAGSARCRKSTSIKISEDLLSQVRPAVNTLSQKMTPQALIETLSTMDGELGDTDIVPSAVGIAVVDELSTLIDKDSFRNGLIALLTDLYDCNDFEYRTRGRGKELVKNPCLSVLGGSTIQWIKESIPEVAIGGGFTSRIVFVYKESREKLVAWPRMSPENEKRREDIIHDLCEIATMRGPFGISNEVIEEYEKEYINFYNHSPLMTDSGLSGYANRRHHILLKVAMIVSASRRDDRIITKPDLDVAINLLRKAEVDMPKVLRTIEANQTGNIFEQILRFIMERQTVNRQQLIRRFRNKMTSQELDVFMSTLEDEGTIVSEVSGKNIKYIFTK
jgi:hypothetical protein